MKLAFRFDNFRRRASPALLGFAHRKLLRLSKDNDLKQVNIHVKGELSPSKQPKMMGQNDMLRYHDKIIQEAKRIKSKIKREKSRLRMN